MNDIDDAATAEEAGGLDPREAAKLLRPDERRSAGSS
jgi:hypothetical protein